ncbi:MAG: Rrf2 family transcriptional regulator [Lachnospirales bacterium]
MQISSRFTIALHILTCIEEFKNDYKITSDFLSSSINVNPVVIRRILQKLKSAGIITVARGNVGSMEINKDLKDITFYDVYKAVDCVDDEGLFHFHENPNPLCPVGRNIHNVLDKRLDAIQQAMENEMKKYTLADVINETSQLIKNED